MIMAEGLQMKERKSFHRTSSWRQLSRQSSKGCRELKLLKSRRSEGPYVSQFRCVGWRDNPDNMATARPNVSAHETRVDFG